MRYPCSACGGRGPHDGPGHQYTTDPNFKQAETDRRVRIVDVISAPNSGVSEMGKVALALAIATLPDPPEEFWRERDGTLPGGPEGTLTDSVELPRADAEALQKRVLALTDHLKYLDAMSASIDAQGMHEIRSVLTVVSLMLDSALEGV